MNNISHNMPTIVCCICFPMVLCALGAQTSTLPPDPNNGALLYYQAFLSRPEPDYVAEQLVYETRMEQFNDVLRGGKLEFGTDTEEQIRQLEEQLDDPNKAPPEVREMMLKLRQVMPEGNYEGQVRSTISRLRQRLEHEQKMAGVDPNKEIRNYLRECRGTIELAQAASEVSECDWGFLYSRGFTLNAPQLTEIRELGTLLRTDALLLAADGDYRAAFRRCLMIRRFARHVGDEGIFPYSTSTTLDGSALYCMRVLFGHMKPDVEILTWLKGELLTETGSPPSVARAFMTEMELALRKLRTNQQLLKSVRDEFVEKAGDDEAAKTIAGLTDEEFIALVQKPYADVLSSLLQVMASEAPHTQKLADMQRLASELEGQFERYFFIHMVMYRPESAPSLYTHQVLHESSCNAFMAGMEIYLARAKTGRLPEELPAGLPKDPFTGKDFTYEVIKDGFGLSFPDKNVPKLKNRRYEFKVRR
ncbi:MAG: hypothetical protein JSW66_17325 [Phycisphaerales bacterium]|nr:MAG: hypothetical protein JSW66_17325 [Phycisphaerales bacterium]